MTQFLRFLLVGLFNTGLGYAIIFSCMYLLGMNHIVSNVIGYAGGFAVSYSLNRCFTFKSRSAPQSEIVRFLVVFAIAYLMNLALLVFAVDQMGVHPAVGQVLAGVIYILVTFLLNKYYVFRQN